MALGQEVGKRDSDAAGCCACGLSSPGRPADRTVLSSAYLRAQVWASQHNDSGRDTVKFTKDL